MVLSKALALLWWQYTRHVGSTLVAVPSACDRLGTRHSAACCFALQPSPFVWVQAALDAHTPLHPVTLSVLPHFYVLPVLYCLPPCRYGLAEFQDIKYVCMGLGKQ